MTRIGLLGLLTQKRQIVGRFLPRLRCQLIDLLLQFDHLQFTPHAQTMEPLEFGRAFLEHFLGDLSLGDVAHHTDNDPVRAGALGMSMHFYLKLRTILAPQLGFRQFVADMAGDDGIVSALQLFSGTARTCDGPNSNNSSRV